MRYGKLDPVGLGSYLAQHKSREVFKVNEVLEYEAKQVNFTFLSKGIYICSEDYSTCPALDDNGNLLFYDYGHWTVAGAKYIGEKIVNFGHLMAAINSE